MALSQAQGGPFYRPVGHSFEPQTGFIVANIAKTDYHYLSQQVLYKGKIFQPKSKLHITIISADEAEALRSYLENNPQEHQHVWDLIDETDWSFRKVDEIYYVEERPGVETIIQRVEIPNLESFFRALSRLTGRGSLLPPMHVTLYTRGTEKGIGLPSQEAFQALVKAQIQPDEIQPVGNTSNGGPEQGLLL